MNKIIGLVITALVSVIVLAVVLIPVLDDATTTHETFTNDGYFRMSKIDTTSEDYTLTWDATDNKVVNANGNDITIPWDSTFPLTLIALENYGVRYTVTLSTQTVTLDLFGPQQNVISSKSVDATITLSEGTMTISSTGSVDQTYSYDVAYVIDLEGDYTLKKGDKPAYVHGDSDIFATGRTQVTIGSNVWLNINVAGNIDDGFIATVFSSNDYTTSNYVVNDEELTQYDDTYLFTNVQFDITADGGTATATYSQVIVPYQITSERSVHLSPAEIEILDILPVFIIIAVLIAAIAVVAFRRE